MPFNSYRELIVWQRSFDLAFEVYQLTRPFPSDERFGITAQLRRAALSISNNIAEGHGRATRGEFLNALSVARGSANEVENCLLFSQRLGFAREPEIGPLLRRINEILRMLARLRSRLQRNMED
jgi:four helix bundle protein